jgi:glycosyltransferase involved in cell wall biosynthesis
LSGREATEVRVVHVLRKCDPTEWGGTETAVQRLCESLEVHGVESVLYCPRLRRPRGAATGPWPHMGCPVKQFHAFLPILGMRREQRQQLHAVGGNLMSLDLPVALWREPGVSVIHSHTLGRLGGIALAVARQRRVPLVVTIHGGVLDLPSPPARVWEWGRIFGLLLRSRELLGRADAILTCNPREAMLLRDQHPGQRIQVQPHGVPMHLYQEEHRADACAAYPQIRGRQVLLCVGRIDPVKNQRWLIEEMPRLLRRHPSAMLVLAGASTNQLYSESLRDRIRQYEFQDRVLLTGGLPPGDPRLLGLFQQARVLLLPSVAETFGLVLLEAWAAGTTVIASRTSGASALVQDGRNGWLFDLKEVSAFHAAVDAALLRPDLAAQFAAEGARLVSTEYDSVTLAGRMRDLYGQLIEEKNALRHIA